MKTQKFRLPNDKEYIEYGVGDVEYDYANVLVSTVDAPLDIGIGYVLRENFPLGETIDANDAIVTKRWFAYSSGAYGDTPGRRIGRTDIGYATMECAIEGLLEECCDNPLVVRKEDDSLPQMGPMTMPSSSRFESYDHEDIVLDVWEETSPSGKLSECVAERIEAQAGIHVMTAHIVRDILSFVSVGLWGYHEMLSNEQVGASIRIAVDLPMDMCGNVIVDKSKPFDGMTLNVEIAPSSHQSAMPHGVLSISVMDVENSVDGNVLVGTSLVSDMRGKLGGLGDTGLSVNSMASEATTKGEMEEFVNHLMAIFMNSLMRFLILEYQSKLMLPYDCMADDSHEESGIRIPYGGNVDQERSHRGSIDAIGGFC